jgi:glycine/D-amino acid oxidase-like deaminating enzyme/nitrite reductase/ring-hydroxylating ferredoxin subunit
MNTQSSWENARLPRYAKLKRAGRYDVVVIGGGITGLTTAYLLKKTGKKVCLLERDRLGGGDTSRTTAHLTAVTDIRPAQLVKTFGKESARLVWQAGQIAVDTIEAVALENEISCEFRRVPGFLHAALLDDRDEARELKADCKQANEMGFDATYMPSVPFIGKPGIRFPNQAKFHPLKYLAGLARAVNGDGCAIHENSEVSEVEDQPLAVKVGNTRIECGYVVIATHVPLMGKAGLAGATLFQMKLAPYSSYAISAKIPSGTIPEASFWDTSNPYFYLRIDAHKGFDEAIFGGEDHKTGQVDDPERRLTRLKHVLQSLIPDAKVQHRWSGQVIETNDKLPYIGETADKQFVATGFGGNGMTFGTFAALMACDRIQGRKNPCQDLFDVNRKKVRGGTWDFIKENVDYPYYYVRDRLFGAENDSTRSVKRGEGKILNVNGERVACSRDEKGSLHQVSAICTHMGCVVHWNGAEQTWDCPCHGSRFHRTGEVLAGPAESPLPPISEKPKRKTAATKSSGRNGKRPRPRSASSKKGR